MKLLAHVRRQCISCDCELATLVRVINSKRGKPYMQNLTHAYTYTSSSTVHIG